MPGRDWRRFVAPAAFLLAATLAVLLIRSGLHAGTTATTTTRVASAPAKTVESATTTTTKKKAKPKPVARFYTVQAGDTFGVISAKTGVTVATIEQLNPNISSTSLFIGEKVRIR